MRNTKRHPLMVLLLVGLGAEAVSAPATAAPAPVVSKQQLYALLGKQVIVSRRFMPSLSGVLVAYDPTSVRLQLGNGRQIRLAREDVSRVRRYPPSRPTPGTQREVASLDELRFRLDPRSTSKPLGAAPTVPTDGPAVPVRGKGLLAGGIVLGSIGVALMLGSGIAALIEDSRATDAMNCSGGFWDYYCENDYDANFKPALGLLVAGGALLAIGTPLMVVGSVRRSLSVAGDGYARTRKRWMYAGIGVTVGGLTLAAGGLALSLTRENDIDGGPSRFGMVMGSAGLFITLLVGLPMWIEAALHPKTRPQDDPHQPPNPATPGAAPAHRKPVVDRRHTDAQHARLTRGLPRTTLFSTQLRF